jgi:hypothetical protein
MILSERSRSNKKLKRDNDSTGCHRGFDRLQVRVHAQSSDPSSSLCSLAACVERLAPGKIGVVAFSSSGDAETGDYDDEPVVILRIGRLPSAFE